MTAALARLISFFMLAWAALFFLAGAMPLQNVWADDDQGGGRGAAVALGWVAIAAGLLANIPFMLYIRVKRISVAALGGGHEITRGMAVQHPAVLNFHMAVNLIGFAAGAVHGIALFRGLDAISLSLAIAMTALVASGIALRFSSANAKYFAKIFHSQIVLSGVLVFLAALHVISMGGID